MDADPFPARFGGRRGIERFPESRSVTPVETPPTSRIVLTRFLRQLRAANTEVRSPPANRCVTETARAHGLRAERLSSSAEAPGYATYALRADSSRAELGILILGQTVPGAPCWFKVLVDIDLVAPPPKTLKTSER